jgi:hypothetical protein
MGINKYTFMFGKFMTDLRRPKQVFQYINPATIGYQRLHATQLELLYKITGKEIFDAYVKRFKKQDTFLNAIRMCKIKYHALKKNWTTIINNIFFAFFI